MNYIAITFLILNRFEQFLYMITQVILYVMHYSLFNVVPIPFNARAPTCSKSVKHVQEERWEFFSILRLDYSFHFVVRVHISSERSHLKIVLQSKDIF